MLDRSIVRLNNWVTRLRGPRVAAENLLILFPHCLQWSDCPHNIVQDLTNCRRCGKCRIKDLIELGERLGCPVFCASGGRQAVERVRAPDIKAVLAVACEKELREGMCAIFPKPVLGVVNLRPHGPCKDTDVDMDAVESAIRELLVEPDADAPQSAAAGNAAPSEDDA